MQSTNENDNGIFFIVWAVVAFLMVMYGFFSQRRIEARLKSFPEEQPEDNLWTKLYRGYLIFQYRNVRLANMVGVVLVMAFLILGILALVGVHLRVG